MEIKDPVPKINSKLSLSAPLPLTSITKTKCSGYFNGFSVIIDNPEHVKMLNTMGFFGKANLSKSFPTFNTRKGEAQLIRKRQYNTRKAWTVKFSSQQPSKVIVVPDSDSENEDYFTNMTVEYQVDKSGISEKLCLALEEAFFLFDAIKCIEIYSKDELLNADQAWKLFTDADHYFVQKYAVYFYFRSKQWVVKPGLKFGGDFLLYKDGPPFYHASYVVIIDVLDAETLERKEDMCQRNMDVVHILGLNRLSENCGKELVICQLMWPKGCEIKTSNDIQKLYINEVLARRWIPSKERDFTEND